MILFEGHGSTPIFIGNGTYLYKIKSISLPTQYIRDLLSKTNMVGAKDVSTPLSTSAYLKLVDRTISFDSTKFISVIGGLQYLSLTCPDIYFSVNKLPQFIHKSTVTHWTTTKRLLHYLKQTIFNGLHIKKVFNSQHTLMLIGQKIMLIELQLQHI